MSFFFEYIFYRINQFYFKWDGRKGATAIVAICLIEMMLLIDSVLFYFRIVNGTNKRHMHPAEQWVVAATLLLLIIYNFRKYGNNYNKYRHYWKDEPQGKRFYKGLFVLLSLVFPVALAFVIGLS